MNLVIKKFFQIEITERLPNNICSHCLKFLQDIFNFIETFKTTDAYLNQILSNELLKADSEKEIKLVYDCIGESFKEINTVDAKLDDVVNYSSEELQNVNKSETQPRQDFKKHVCNICGNHFVRLGGLKRHMKIHLGIKSFKCGRCNKTFQEKLALNRHILIHTGLCV